MCLRTRICDKMGHNLNGKLLKPKFVLRVEGLFCIMHSFHKTIMKNT